MTYEEACKELDEACKDWEVINANYKLEKLAYETSCKEHQRNMQISLGNVFGKLTHNTITVEAVPTPNSQKYMLRVFIRCENGEVHHGDCYAWGIKESQNVIICLPYFDRFITFCYLSISPNHFVVSVLL